MYSTINNSSLNIFQAIPSKVKTILSSTQETVSFGGAPDLGDTVRFIPHRCMMQKVHSGVVVRSEGDKVRIESVDLKVWG